MRRGPQFGESNSRERSRSPATLAHRVVVALVMTPGRSAAVLLTAVPYAWLAYYVVGTALGHVGDPIVGGDWLTLLFTSYAFVFPLALAHRTLRIGLTELTQEYLVDVVVLLWLTVFYVVWMLAREPVAPATSTAELYGPVLAGEAKALTWTAVAAPVAVVVAGVSAAPREGSALFRSPFRTLLVTVSGIVTALVLVLHPGPESLLWPAIAGAFVGTLLGGVLHLPTVASALARAAFAVLAFAVWTVGVGCWLVAFRQLPPTRQLRLGHAAFGTVPDGSETDETGGETDTGGVATPDGGVTDSTMTDGGDHPGR